MFRRPELSRRDFDFLQEKYDTIADQLKTVLRLAETQERAHLAELKAMSQRIEIAEGRLAALDSWTQAIATARGLGSPSPSIETLYEGFEDEEIPGFDPDDLSVENMLNMVGPVPMPQTENSEPVSDEGESSMG